MIRRDLVRQIPAPDQLRLNTMDERLKFAGNEKYIRDDFFGRSES